ncbi:polysaccharide biosynthesis tyrosine autokinase [Flavitalea sp. BT771]|uniref:GumC family protein n=1 Tax=Flavitalea sp. BT771 TaxID=3063329 RepID=UPI0026E2A212|nr:polysaccharide biosynthesis tyrosine autokinase [Flavitalea sp. BT771]MDO6434166.1 polysaccharide biosynthesis tyrosine autokinase [Flavitalea sp. BT771]MDV6223066.1 polysaccharide biosynthesis tyrosine autokinase [Flavitalea sp. BT771]
MSDSEIRTGIPEHSSLQDNRWKISPREFIFRYLWLIPWILISAFVFIVLAYIKVRYTTQIYQVKASLLIKNDRDNGGGGKDPRFEELFMAQGNVNLNNEVEILKSRPVLSRVVKDIQLQSLCYNRGKVRSSLIYPERPINIQFTRIADSSADISYKILMLDNGRFLLNEGKNPIPFGQEIEEGGNRFRIDTTAGMDFSNYGSREFELRHLSISSAVESLVGDLRVAQPADQSTILTLTFDSESKNLGRDVLNTLMAVYDTLIVEDKTKISTNTLKFINDRLFELNDTLRGVQGVLRNFMVENQAFDIEGQSKAYLDKVGESGKEKVAQAVKLSIVNWLMDYVGDKKNVYELVPTNLGIEEPALLQMVSEYNRLQLERDNYLKTTSESNQLIQNLNSSLERVRRDIYQALMNVKQAYTIAQSHLEKENQVLQGHITSLPGKSMQLLNIERQQKILEDLYSLLLQKKIETSISSASTISNSRIIEPAIGSSVPVSPDKKKIFTFYFLLGLLIPVGITALREVLKDKVSGRADVEKQTQAPILGEIGHSEGQATLVVALNSRRFISEQFRIIRTNLQYIINRKDRPVIMVTSSFSGEGKSFISTNIGAVMALSGRKTVIMEFDIRKPKIVSGLDLKRKMGITNYIIGKASFEELLVKVEGVDNLYVIPCGPIPPNPAELLLDPRLNELMEEVMKAFEVVIMDTAPVGLVSDAITLGKYADCTLYIIRQGHTFRKQLGMIEDLYVSRKLPSLSLLLNDVKVGAGYYGGYYGGGYGYYGAYGYGHESGYFEDEKRKSNTSNIFSPLAKLWKRWFG